MTLKIAVTDVDVDAPRLSIRERNKEHVPVNIAHQNTKERNRNKMGTQMFPSCFWNVPKSQSGTCNPGTYGKMTPVKMKHVI